MTWWFGCRNLVLSSEDRKNEASIFLNNMEYIYLSVHVHWIHCTWAEDVIYMYSNYTKCIDIPQGLLQHQED